MSGRALASTFFIFWKMSGKFSIHWLRKIKDEFFILQIKKVNPKVVTLVNSTLGWIIVTEDPVYIRKSF
jgi:hypothetical protein